MRGELQQIPTPVLVRGSFKKPHKPELNQTWQALLGIVAEGFDYIRVF